MGPSSPEINYLAKPGLALGALDCNFQFLAVTVARIPKPQPLTLAGAKPSEKRTVDLCATTNDYEQRSNYHGDTTQSRLNVRVGVLPRSPKVSRGPPPIPFDIEAAEQGGGAFGSSVAQSCRNISLLAQDRKAYGKQDKKKVNKIIEGFFARSASPARPLTAVKHIFPVASQHDPQAHQRRKAWEVIPRLNALDVTRAQTRFFGQFFLSKISSDPQRGHIFPKSHPM
jgi:hypothetical protein